MTLLGTMDPSCLPGAKCCEPDAPGGSSAPDGSSPSLSGLLVTPIAKAPADEVLPTHGKAKWTIRLLKQYIAVIGFLSLVFSICSMMWLCTPTEQTLISMPFPNVRVMFVTRRRGITSSPRRSRM